MLKLDGCSTESIDNQRMDEDSSSSRNVVDTAGSGGGGGSSASVVAPPSGNTMAAFSAAAVQALAPGLFDSPMVRLSLLIRRRGNLLVDKPSF